MTEPIRPFFERRGAGPPQDRRRGDILWKWVRRTICALILALVGGVGIGIGDILADQAATETSGYWARWVHGDDAKQHQPCP